MDSNYTFLNEQYKPNQDVIKKIEKDIEWIREVSMDEGHRRFPRHYLADEKGFEEVVSKDGPRLFCYTSQIPQTIYWADGFIVGSYTLSKPLEKLTEEELHKLSKKGVFKLNILRKLKELTISKK